MPAASSNVVAAPSDEDRLAVAVLVLQRTRAPGRAAASVACAARPPARPPRPRAPTASSPASPRRRCGVAGLRLDAAEPRADEARHRAGRGERRVRRAQRHRRRRRRTTSIATRRAATPPSPGRANSESAGETVDLGLRRVLEHARLRRAAPACRGRRRPRCASVAVDVREHRDDALADRLGLHARQLEAERADDVVLLDRRLALPEQRRLGVVVGELLGLGAHLVLEHRRAGTT